MLNKTFIEEYKKIIKNSKGNTEETIKKIEELEKEFRILPVNISTKSERIVYISFNYPIYDPITFFNENGVDFIIGFSENDKSYLFRVENMSKNDKLSIKNASLFYFPINNGLSFKFLSENKIIMRVSYVSEHQNNDDFEIYKTYEYNYNKCWDASVYNMKIFSSEKIAAYLPLLFMNGQAVQNGKELWEMAYTTKSDLLRTRTKE